MREILDNSYFSQDFSRYFGAPPNIRTLILNVPKYPELIFLLFFRLASLSDRLGIFLRFFARVNYHILVKLFHFQIPLTVNIGPGFYIGHFGRIILHPDTRIGRNVNIGTGVTIGAEVRGPRNGVPIIGDSVWIGTNAVIVGKIEIGDNVLIAPNAFVNRDIPSNSIAFGNPIIIKPNLSATEGYITNKV